MSYTRFFIPQQGEVDRQDVSKKLNLFRFRPLHEKAEDTESMGWCPFLSEYDDDKEIGPADVLYDDKIILTLRIDSIIFPRDLLKSLVKKSLSSYENDFNKKADRRVKKELEMAEMKSLRSKVLPKTKIVPAIWCPNTSSIRIFSKSNPLLDHFIDTFQHTFLLRPIRRDFAFQAVELLGEKGEIAKLDVVSHKPLFAPPIRIDVQ